MHFFSFDISIMYKNFHRTIQFDVMKIIATFAVVWLHVAAQRFNECYPSMEWDIRNIYDSMVRWAVPIFVMVSGALFLNPKKEIGIKRLYSKNISRLVLIFFFWSIVYCVYGGVSEKGFVAFAEDVLWGPFHFWFLKMLIGLYICVPILRPIVTNRKVELYLLCLSLVTAFIIPMLFPILGFFNDGARHYAERFIDAFGIKIALGYVGYFVFGHYLAHTVVCGKVKKCLCLLGIISVMAVCFLTRIVSNCLGTPSAVLYGYINLFTLFEATAVFLVVKDIKVSPKYYNVLVNLSKLSLGVYVIHLLVMSIIFNMWGVFSASLNPIYFIPVYTLIVFALSYLLSFVLSKIPFIRKFVS